MEGEGEEIRSKLSKQHEICIDLHSFSTKWEIKMLQNAVGDGLFPPESTGFVDTVYESMG